jgi:hypothetical protein
MEPARSAAAGGAFVALLYLVMMVGMIGAWIISLVALWRGMKAHESIAETLKEIAQK